MFPRLFAISTLVILIGTQSTLPAGASGAQSIALKLDVGPDQFVALRLNLSDNNDLDFGTTTRSCTGTESARPVVGGVNWLIKNGKPQISALSSGNLYWFFDENNRSTLARAHAGPAYVTAPTSNHYQKSWCSGIGDGEMGHGFGPTKQQVVFIDLMMGGAGIYWFNATWTRGLDSWDYYVGNGTAMTRDDMPGGVAATVYPLGPSVAALESYHLEATTDVVGYFRPGGAENQAWSCTKNGGPCPPPFWSNMADVYAKPGDDWHLNVTYNVGIAGWPPYILGLCPLPDDSYIY